ncbi:7278_t:CDS:1, partial [Racocetra persica]
EVVKKGIGCVVKPGSTWFDFDKLCLEVKVNVQNIQNPCEPSYI